MKRPSGFGLAAVAVLVLLAACETGTGPDPDAAFEQSALCSLAGVAPSSASAQVASVPADPSSNPGATATDATTADPTTTGDATHTATCLDFSTGSFLLVPCLATPLKKGAADRAHGDPEPWRPGTPIPPSW